MNTSRTSLFLPGIQIALLLLAVILLYAGSLSAPLVFDDMDFFRNPAALSRYGHSYFNFDLRWLPYATLGWTVNWLGLDLVWLRLGNVLLHAANAIALFFLLRRLFQVTLADRESLSSSLTWFAFFGALLFALHPVAVYGVTYLIQRSILMATLFMLLMLLVYLEGLMRNSWRWMLAAAACYFAAVYSKEHSIMAPGVALAMTFLIRKPSPALFRQVLPFYLLAALIAASVLFNTRGVVGELYEPDALDILGRMGLTDASNVHWLSILTQSWLLFKYLWLWLLPDPAWMSVDMREPFALSLLGWHTLGLVAFLAYPCVALWLLLKQGRMGLLGFALLFPWILFLTEWSVIRIQEPFVLYRSYLWMPGLFAAVPVLTLRPRSGLKALSKRPLAFGSLSPKRAFILLGAVCLLLVPLALNRMHTFSSAFLLWDDAEKLVHGKPGVYGIERIYYNRGTELGRLERYDEAIADFNKAIIEGPNFAKQYSNRGTAYYYLGKYHEALSDYNHAIAIDPDMAQSYYGRFMTYRALGDFAAAQQNFRRSCALGLCLDPGK